MTLLPSHKQIMKNIHETLDLFQKKPHVGSQREYPFILDPISGRFHFEEKPSIKGGIKAKMIVKEPTLTDPASFSMSIIEGTLQREVKKIVDKTLQVLNAYTQDYAGGNVEEFVCKRADQGSYSIEGHPGWHAKLSCLEAEKLLLEKSEGSYLLTDLDPTSFLIQEKIEEEFDVDLKCYLLCVKTNKNKISYYLIVHEHLWYFYDDEPKLWSKKMDRYPTLEELINACKEAKYPVIQ